MAKPVQPASARELLTVRAFARFAGVSERKVWYDVTSGRLVRAPGRPTRIPRSALSTYRQPVSLTARWLLTPREVSLGLGCSLRTVRRRIREGKFVIAKVSARRLLIDAAHSYVGERIDGTAVTIAEVVRLDEPLRESQPELRRARVFRTQQRQVFVAESIRHLARHAATPVSSYPLFTVAQIAEFSRKSRRAVYHDVFKGALPCLNLSRIRVPWPTVIAYIDRPDATEAIITWVVSMLFSGADTVTRAEIAGGFADWWRASAERL